MYCVMIVFALIMSCITLNPVHAVENWKHRSLNYKKGITVYVINTVCTFILSYKLTDVFFLSDGNCSIWSLKCSNINSAANKSQDAGYAAEFVWAFQWPNTAISITENKTSVGGNFCERFACDIVCQFKICLLHHDGSMMMTWTAAELPSQKSCRLSLPLLVCTEFTGFFCHISEF